MKTGDIVTINNDSRYGKVMSAHKYKGGGGGTLYRVRYIDPNTGRLTKCPRCTGNDVSCPICGRSIRPSDGSVLSEHDLQYYRQSGMLKL